MGKIFHFCIIIVYLSKYETHRKTKSKPVPTTT